MITLTGLRRQRIWERDQGVCWLCREPVRLEQSEIDHVVPTARGGDNDDDNVKIAHWRCNRVKCDRPVNELPADTGGDLLPPWMTRNPKAPYEYGHALPQLKRLRLEQGMSVQKLATETGLSWGTIYSIERGTRASPGTEHALSKALGVPWLALR